MTSGVSQNENILGWLKAGHTLTPIDALECFGCFRLAARVKDLRDDGYDIQTDSLELTNGKKVARYWLPQPKGQLDFFGQQKGPVVEVHRGHLEQHRSIA